MRGERLCLGLLGEIGLNDEEQIRLMKQVGFDGFFSGWEPGTDVCALRAAADETGMIWQSIHAPFGKMASMWKEMEETGAAVEELTGCVRACAQAKVDLMIVHAFIGFEDHEPTDFGVENFRKIVGEAKRLGVRIAFENVEGEEYLFALMDAFKEEAHVGFCWDTGHQMCYNPDTDMMALYGERLFGTHLNDNLGVKDAEGKITWIDDLHLLPFDGAGDWEKIAAKIGRSGFGGPLTFELSRVSKPGRNENDPYARMEFADYLHEAYKRACRLGAMVMKARI